VRLCVAGAAEEERGEAAARPAVASAT